MSQYLPSVSGILSLFSKLTGPSSSTEEPPECTESVVPVEYDLDDCVLSFTKTGEVILDIPSSVLVDGVPVDVGGERLHNIAVKAWNSTSHIVHKPKTDWDDLWKEANAAVLESLRQSFDALNSKNIQRPVRKEKSFTVSPSFYGRHPGAMTRTRDGGYMFEETYLDRARSKHILESGPDTVKFFDGSLFWKNKGQYWKDNDFKTLPELVMNSRSHRTLLGEKAQDFISYMKSRMESVEKGAGEDYQKYCQSVQTLASDWLRSSRLEMKHLGPSRVTKERLSRLVARRQEKAATTSTNSSPHKYTDNELE